jgi:phosphoribosyl-AMP cyclohydrolase
MTKPIFAPRGTPAEIEQGTAFAPKFDAAGLIPAIVTDAASGTVLMFAWMNAAALHGTIETGWATYWSRSRGELWVKGATSSNRQKVVELRTDCDQDVVWLKVAVEGHGASCHTGQVSCFYRAVPVGQPVSTDLRLERCEGVPVFDPARVYEKKK